MKRLVFFLLVLLAFAAAYGAMTYTVDNEPTAYWWTGNPTGDRGWAFLKEVEGIIEATSLDNSKLYTGATREVEHILANDTLTTTESGKLIYVAKAGAGAAADVVVTLPAAAAGLEFIIVDANETAGADVTITAGTGDKINDGSAAASYIHDTDADNYALCHLVAIDATDWVVWSETGTWANE
jgi:hypothetical protein